MIQTRTTQQRNKQAMDTVNRPLYAALDRSLAIITRMAVIGVAVALHALSASAQTAKDVKGATPLVAIQDEPAVNRGQIDDWFGSGFITTTILIALFGWIGTVVWELYTKEPIIDFRLLNNRNFAIACGLFFVFGIGLFGTTTLIPQLLQSLYGYRAIDAGLVLGPGALVITCLAPISAQLLQRNVVSAKTLVLLSLAAVATAMIIFSNLNLNTDGSHFRWIRSIQGFGYGLFLVPVNLIAYSQLRPEQNNKASSLTTCSAIGAEALASPLSRRLWNGEPNSIN